MKKRIKDTVCYVKLVGCIVMDIGLLVAAWALWGVYLLVGRRGWIDFACSRIARAAYVLYARVLLLCKD